MGLFDLLFGNKENTPPKGATLSLTELPSWITAEKKASGKIILENAGASLARIEDALRGIDAQLDKISSSKMHESVPDRFIKIVAGSKPKYLKGMKAFVSTASPRKTGSIDELSAYASKLSGSLDEIAKINLGEGRYLPLAYGAELEKIQKKAKLIQDEREKLETTLGDEHYKNLSDLTDFVERISGLDAGGGSDEEGPETYDITTKIRKIEKELKKIEKGAEMKSLKKLRDSHDEKTKEREKIEAVIHASLRSLDRDMKRYKRPCPEELSPALDEVLTDPVEYFLADGEGQVAALLAALLLDVSSGSFEVKDRNKTVKKIRDSQEKLTTKLSGKHAELSDELKKIEAEISENTVEDEIRKRSSEKKALEEKYARMLKEAENAKNRGESLKAEKRKLISELSKKLSDDFNVTLK